MKKNIMLAFAAIIIALPQSCTVKEEEAPVNNGERFEWFVASMESVQDTKVYADDQLRVLWNAKDHISLFNRYTYNQDYVFEGEDGANSGVFSKVPDDVVAVGNDLPYVYAVYPYSESNSISNDGVISVTIPSTQTYAKGTFAPGVNVMVSATSDQYLKFKNVCGILGVKLFGVGKTVNSIELSGNKGEIIAGEALVEVSSGAAPSTTMKDGGATSIKLLCGDAVELSSDSTQYEEFWFMLPPVVFTEGFTVIVNGPEGSFSKTTTKKISVNRNEISRMAPLEMVYDISYTEPDAVDLGLPSGTLWANCNLGASSPEEFGCYYAWGETEPKENYSWSTYEWCNGDYNKLTKYCPSNKTGYWDGSGSPDKKTVLDPEDDAAHVNWGGDWRMPTISEWLELIDNCTWTWTSNYNGTGVAGRIVTSNKAGYTDKSIFLPAAGSRGDTNPNFSGSDGNYWSSSLVTADPYVAYYVDVNADYVTWYDGDRGNGQSVRPVKNSPPLTISFMSEEHYKEWGLISMWEFSGPKYSSEFPFIRQLSQSTRASFIGTSPVKLSYKLAPQRASEDYEWSFVNKTISAEGSYLKSDLVSILQGPIQTGDIIEFWITLNNSVGPVDPDGLDNNVIALRAVPVVSMGEGSISDFALVSGEWSNYSYSIIDRQKNSTGQYAPFRTSYIGPDDSDCDLQIIDDQEVDLMDYLEAFAEQSCRPVSEVLPHQVQYEFFYAGMKQGDSKVVIAKNANDAPYYDTAGNNHNAWLTLDGSKISLNKSAGELPLSTGLMPLVYARATYRGSPLAECLLKIHVKTTSIHEHEFTIQDWQLNEDYLLGTQNKVICVIPDPYKDKDYFNEPFKTYAGLGDYNYATNLPVENRLPLIDQFNKSKVEVNLESEYTFTLENIHSYYVFFEDDPFSSENVFINTTNHSCVKVSGAELLKWVNGDHEGVFINYESLNIILNPQPILISVTESCTSESTESLTGFYYFLPRLDVRHCFPLSLELKYPDIELGTFRDTNDYLMVNELIEGVYDREGNILYRWDPNSGRWGWSDEAINIYGIGDDSLSFVFTLDLYYPDDSQDSFGGRLNVFDAGDSLGPTPKDNAGNLLELPDRGINWWNMGADLITEKKAGLEISTYLYESSNNQWELFEITLVDVIVSATGVKPAPYHNSDGTWNPNKGWDYFLKYDIEFKWDQLGDIPTYTGKSGRIYIPHEYKSYDRKTLEMSADDFETFVLNDAAVSMSSEDFYSNYNKPKIVLKKEKKYTPYEYLVVPPDGFLPDVRRDEQDKYSLVGIENLLHFYPSGLSYAYQFGPNGAAMHFRLNYEFSNTNESYSIYVIYPAKDNTKHIDVVVEYCFIVKS